MEESKFTRELEQLINKYSVESESNTPDFILAEYLNNCLNTFNLAVKRRKDWYGRNKPSKEIITLQDDAIMLENAAYNHNYHNYCARLTLGILPPVTPYSLLDSDYGRVRSASEKERIRQIIKERNTFYDISKNAYDNWEITLIKMNGCPCGHNGKILPPNSEIMQVRVCDKRFEIGQRIWDGGIIEKFNYCNNGRVSVVIEYETALCPLRFTNRTKYTDIVNLITT